MKLTSHDEYGLRCLIRLGQEGAGGKLTSLRSAMPKASRRPMSASCCGYCAWADSSRLRAVPAAILWRARPTRSSWAT